LEKRVKNIFSFAPSKHIAAVLCRYCCSAQILALPFQPRFEAAQVAFLVCPERERKLAAPHVGKE